MDNNKENSFVWNWVWDYILKNPINDKTFNSLLLTLPLPTNNPNLPKLILLKKLQSQNSFHEADLSLIEQLHEIDTLKCVQTSDAMKRAYCAVAVELTVNHLTKVGEEVSDREFMFFEIVKRVWRNRIGRMKLELGEGGLGSEELWDWMDQLEAAVWDIDVLDTVLDKSKGINAVDAVRVYLNEEMEKVGTSFLESLRDRVDSDDVLKEMAGLIDNNADDGLDREMNQLRNTRVGGYKRSRGAKITDCDEDVVADPPERICKSVLSAETKNTQIALESSLRHLREVVKDPLPEALRVAEQIHLSSRKGKGVEKDCVRVVDDDVVVQEPPQSRVPEKDAKEQNGPVQSSRVGLGSSRGEKRVCSPRKKIQSLSKDEIANLKSRRAPRKWTPVEEDTLRAGVRKYGKGNWMLILTVYKDVFIDRTEVDLKDKWRNMTRYTQLSGTLTCKW